MLNRRRHLQHLAALPLAAALPTGAQTPHPAPAALAPAAPTATLRFGVVPYLTARRLMTLFEPARAFFERDLRQPVQFNLAADYAAHLAKLRAQAYDITAEALLFARLAQREIGYVPFARTAAPLEPVLVARRGAPVVRQIGELRGQIVAVSDHLGPMTIIALRFLRDQGLQRGTDIGIRAAGNQANSIQLLLLDQVALAVVSKTALQQVDPAQAAQLQVVRELPTALSTMVYMLAPQRSAWAADLSRSFIHFASHEAAGRAFIDALGHQGLLPVLPGQLEGLDPLVLELHRQLAAQL